MKCKNCGANVPDNVTECPFCCSKIEVPAEVKINSTDVRTKVYSQNPLLGKEYSFSGNDLVIKGRWGIRFKVTVGEDRLHFETVPERKNLLPAIMLEDILAIEESFHMRIANILIGIFGLLLGFAGGYWGFVLPIFVLLFYRERKIKIHLRNGKVLTIYSDDGESIAQFIEDMKKITEIKK